MDAFEYGLCYSAGAVPVRWAGSAVCEFLACSVAVTVASAVGAEYSVSAFVSHVSLFTISEASWHISISIA